MAEPMLFEFAEVRPARPPDGAASLERLSTDRRRTLLQAARLAAGLHPLTAVTARSLRLHPQAADAGDRAADGRRCGNCRFRRPAGGASDRVWPKCFYADHGLRAARVTSGPATDCRAWWPGCVDHEYGDPQLPDAARWNPGAAAHDLAVTR